MRLPFVAVYFVLPPIFETIKIYFVIIDVIYSVYRFLSGKILVNDLIFMLVIVAISSLVFYIMSKKYITK